MVKAIATGQLPSDAVIMTTKGTTQKQYLSFELKCKDAKDQMTCYTVRTWNLSSYPKLRTGVWASVFGSFLYCTPENAHTAEPHLLIIADEITICTISHDKTVNFDFKKI